MKTLLVTNGEMVETTNETRNLGHGKQIKVIYSDGSDGWEHIADLYSATIIVSSSNGTIEIEPVTGMVIEINDESDDQCLSGITQFDLTEFKSHYHIETPEAMPETIDILDLGYWCSNEYVGPEEDWRAEYRTTDFYSDQPSPTKFMQKQTEPPIVSQPLKVAFKHGVKLYPEMITDNFDAIEVHPLAYIGKLANGEDVWDVCDPEQADMWGVYIHFGEAMGGECIAECSDEETARQLASMLEKIGELFYRNPEADM
jgi:hypothetical protein